MSRADDLYAKYSTSKRFSTKSTDKDEEKKKQYASKADELYDKYSTSRRFQSSLINADSGDSKEVFRFDTSAEAEPAKKTAVNFAQGENRLQTQSNTQPQPSIEKYPYNASKGKSTIYLPKSYPEQAPSIIQAGKEFIADGEADNTLLKRQVRSYIDATPAVADPSYKSAAGTLDAEYDSKVKEINSTDYAPRERNFALREAELEYEIKKLNLIETTLTPEEDTEMKISVVPHDIGFGNNERRDQRNTFETNADKKLKEDAARKANPYYDDVQKAGQYKKKLSDELEALRSQRNEEVAAVQEGQEIYEKIEDNDVLEIAFKLAAGVENGVVSIGNRIADKDYYAPSSWQIADSLATEDLNQDGIFLPEWLGGGTLGGAIGDAAYSIGNMVPALAAGVAATYLSKGALGAESAAMIGEAAFATTFGASVYGNAYAEAINNGYDKEIAGSYASAIAASEVLSNYYLGGISKVGGKLTNNALKKVLDRVSSTALKTAATFTGKVGSEMFEEWGQAIIEPTLKNIILGESNEIDPLSPEALYSGMLGGFTALVLEGAPSGVSSSVNAARTYRTGKAIKNNANFDVTNLTNLAKNGSTMSADSVAYKIADKVNDKTGAYTIGKLFHAIGAELSVQNQQDIVKSLTLKGVAPENAETIADWLGATVNGAKLTKQQINALELNEDIANTFRDVIINPNSTINQRRQAWFEAGGFDVASNADADMNAYSPDAVMDRINESQMLTTQSAPSLEIQLAQLAQEKASKSTEAPTAEQSNPFIPLAKQTAPVQNTEKIKALDSVVAKEHDVSDIEGKTIIKNTNEAVNIKKITSIDKNSMTLELDDGREVSSRDISYASEGEALVYETVADITNSAESANAIINAFDVAKPKNANAWAAGARMVYTDGKNSIPFSEIAQQDFTSYLSNEAKKLIYNLGQQDAITETAKAEKAKKTTNKKAKGKGRVTFEGKENFSTDGFTDVQRASVAYANIISKITGVEVRLYESEKVNGRFVYTDENGEVKAAPNGKYIPGSNIIMLDINAGENGEGTMLYTLAHELTHYIKEWSPAKFKSLANFLMEQYGKQGRSVDELVQAQIRKAKSNRKTIDYDTAYEEVIADSMEAMLVDGKVIEKLQQLYKQDKSLYRKIVDFVNKWVDKVKQVYTEYSPDSKEGKLVLKMLDTTERLQELFAEAIMDASVNYKSAVQQVVESKATPISNSEIITDGAVVTDGDGVKYSIKSMKHDIAEGKMFDDLKQYCGFTNKEVNKLKARLEDLVQYMTLNREILDINETYGREGRRFSPYKPNSDPLYTISLDYSTQCSKRLLTQYVIEQLQLRENRPMSAEEQMAIRDMLKEYGKIEKGIEVACVMCYVEAARLKSPKQINRWLTDPEPHLINYFAQKNPIFKAKVEKAQSDFKISKGYEANTPKKDMKPADRTALDKMSSKLRSQYKPTTAEKEIIKTAKSLPNSTYLTSGNLADLSESHPEIYKAYSTFVRSATRSKPLETDEPYYYGDSTRDNGNGIVVSDSFIKAVNRENGMRFSSWSDWRIQHMLDWITAVIENSVRGAAMHGYTKYGDEVRVLGKTGMMFNMSGVAGTQTGLNEDGSLSFSDTESINYDEAIELREQFPETAGLQCIGVSVEHIFALLRSNIIDYVIPYHTSGLNAGLRRMGNIYGWKNFTSTQHAAKDSSVKKENAVDPDNWHKEPVFSEFFVGYDTGLNGYEAMKQSAENYKRMCKERGLIPKFAEFANEDNYWKLLIDRKMVNQKNNTLIKQKPVSPVFDFDAIKSIVDKYVENYDSGLEQRALDYVVENWDYLPQRIRDLKKQGTAKAKTTRKAVNTLANETLAAQPNENDLKLSDRDPEAITPRNLLANALESTAANDIERKKLEQYKKKIDSMNAEEKKLSEIRKEIKELSFSKGKRDTEKLKQLKEEATKAANRITTYDRQLLNLESTQALKNVLEREKKKAVEKQKQRDKEALKAYKEQVEQKQQKIIENYRESRQNATESRHRTEMRNKIKKVVNELNQYLLKGTKDKHVSEGMQTAVAEALSIVNMDTVDADARVAKYDALIAEATDPDVIESLTATRDRIQGQGDKLKSKLEALQLGYAKIKQSSDPSLASAYNKGIEDKIASVVDVVGNTPLRNMSMNQLEEVYDLYKLVLTSIRDRNKMFVTAQKETVQELGIEAKTELSEVSKKIEYINSVNKLLRKIGYKDLKPIYFFRMLGSKTMTKLYKAVSNGQGTWYKDMREAKSFRIKAEKEHNYKNWDMKKTYSFTSNSGSSFKLTLQQIMTIYAYYRRDEEKAIRHLVDGGFVFDKSISVIKKEKGVPVKYYVNTAEAFNLSETIINNIISTLSDEQRAYVEKMQAYLSDTMGAKGNEVSLKLYDVKLFKEKNYFPIKSSGTYMDYNPEESGEVKIKNSGFTKATNQFANNPIVLSDFIDVWTSHVNDMSMYHAFVLPLEDFTRVYNYRNITDRRGAIQATIETNYTEAANSYIKQLLKDINGGSVSGVGTEVIDKMVGLAKKGAVFASASVVVQQPSAIARAMAYVKPKYFVNVSSFNLKRHNQLWEECKQYAPVAGIKEMGYFDTSVGRTGIDWLKADEYDSVREKFFAFFKDKEQRRNIFDDALSFAPAMADELSWVALWEAVKKETRKTTNLEVGSEEFFKHCGERFTEVVDLTQVYDSVFARSELMRSKDRSVKMATSFMAEPTTQVNMLFDAVLQLKRGKKSALAPAAATIGAVVGSVVLNSILKSFVLAGRDDDEEETYFEKYVASFTDDVINGLNPLTLIPFVKDFVSIVQGYSVDRMDMTVIESLITSVMALGKEAETPADKHKKWSNFVGAVTQLFGIPAKNIIRDFTGAFNTYNIFTSGNKTTETGVKYALLEGLSETPTAILTDKLSGGKLGIDVSKGKQYYDAVMGGDTAHANRIVASYDDKKKADNAIVDALEKFEPRITEAAQAHIDGSTTERVRISKEIIADGFAQDCVVKAVNRMISKLEKGEGESESSGKPKSLYTKEDYFNAAYDGNTSEANTYKEELIKFDMDTNDKTREEAESSFNSSFKSAVRKAVVKDGLTMEKATRMLADYGDVTEEKAYELAQGYDFVAQHPDLNYGWEADTVAKYLEKAEPAGISVSVYDDYLVKKSQCKGVDRNNDGKADKGTKKAQIYKMIDSLPITSHQKAVLKLMNK